MNAKQGKMAMFVKSLVPRRRNYGKIFLLERLATREEAEQILYRGDHGPLWKIDKGMVWYHTSVGLYEAKFVPDDCIKLLPDLGEDEELIKVKELEKENG